MKRPRALTIALALCLLPLASAGQAPVTPTRTELAPGIFLFSRAGYGDVGLDGNSIVVTSRDGVLVFDTNGTPGASAAVLSEIRKLTDQPVRCIVNSHWHWDHWYGTETYLQAFPDVRVVSHEKNRQLMMRSGARVQQAVPRAAAAGLPSERREAGRREAGARAAARRRQGVLTSRRRTSTSCFPTSPSPIAWTIELGERHIEVLNYGRGVTPGDTFVYLPKEKVLLLGDLIVNPITFALSGFPTEWLRVLEKVDALDATTIVTGHGAPLHDKVAAARDDGCVPGAAEGREGRERKRTQIPIRRRTRSSPASTI